MTDGFVHRTVDAATAPRVAPLGASSPFAMAATYLAGKPKTTAAAVPLVDETDSAAPAATKASPAAEATSAVPEPLRIEFLAGGGSHASIGDRGRYLTPRETLQLGARLVAHAAQEAS